MTKSDFFRLLGEAAKYSTPVAVAGTQLQLNAFSVLRSPTDLLADNLNRTIFDKDKPFFYSRKWEAFNHNPNRVEFDYPILVAYDLEPRLLNLFSGNSPQTCYNIRLDVLYPNVDRASLEIKKACKYLLTDEIYIVARALLVQALSYIKNAVYTNVDGVDGWHNRNKLDYDGIVYEDIVIETNSFKRRMRETNASLQGFYIDDESKDILCGVGFMMQFCESACLVEDNSFNQINCC